MAKDPAFLFYSSDFLSGIADLTMEERGQYITLLCLQHQKGNLTEKTIKISVPNVSKDVLLKFSQDQEGNFFNKRLLDEVVKRKIHSEKQRENVLKRWNKNTNEYTNTIPKLYDGITNVIPLENVNENVNENKDIIVLKKSEKTFIPTIEEFLEYSKEILDVAYYRLEPALKLKYESWKVNGWKTGGEKSRAIKNWKNTLANTVPYLKPTEQKEFKSLSEKMRYERGIN